MTSCRRPRPRRLPTRRAEPPGGANKPLGEFESEASAAWLGPVASVVWGGVGTIGVVALWARLFPALARHDRLVKTDHNDEIPRGRA